jgi:hypothetical protein
MFTAFRRYALMTVTLFLYAAITGLLAGLLVWSHVDVFVPSDQYSTSPVADKEVRYCMARVFQQWSLEQRPDPGALDGYEIDIDYKPILIDTEKAKTAWERIVAMRVLNHEPPASILPGLASIDDQHEKAQAIKTLSASLRTGSLPPHPFRLSVSSGSAPLDIMTTPSFVPAPAVISSDPAPRPNPHSPSPPAVVCLGNLSRPW